MKLSTLTVEELHKVLAEHFGIEPVRLEDGQWGYKREQFEKAWELLDKKDKKEGRS